MAAARALVVHDIDRPADRIVALTLVHPAGAPLEPWTPGAHVDVTLPSGAVRSYSLCGDPADRLSYTIAVLREDAGRGASIALHDTHGVGATLEVAAPRNTFPLVEATHHVLIAGGIGITPVLPMMRQLAASGASFEAYYLGRSRRAMAFLPAVAACRTRHGSPTVIAADEGRRLDIAAVFAAAPGGSVVTCCGPERLLLATEAAASSPSGAHCTLRVERFGRPDLGRGPLRWAHGSDKPSLSFHEERASDRTQTSAAFASDALADAEPLPAADPKTTALCDPDGPFDVVLKRTGVTLQVPAEKTILEVVRMVCRALTFSCSSGYCGTCEVRVLGGLPCHRDEVLSVSEKAANGSMMICVGRSRTACLVLDL